MGYTDYPNQSDNYLITQTIRLITQTIRLITREEHTEKYTLYIIHIVYRVNEGILNPTPYQNRKEESTHDTD